MKIELWPIARPVPYAKNARKITGASIDKTAASIREFGWQQPIVVDAHDTIICGHTRVLAARKLGLTEVPVHVARDLTPAQVKAYRLMDNRAAQENKWDFGLLNVELMELKDLDINIALTGFDVGEISKILLDPLADAPDAAVTQAVQVFGVILELADEAQQVELLDEFNGRGFKCRALL